MVGGGKSPLGKHWNLLQLHRMSGRFAHYSFTTAAMVARYCARGKRATDEMLLEAFRHIDPPLLGQRDAFAIAHILGGKLGRRPASIPSTGSLARKLQSSGRDDIPPRYLGELLNRLRKPRGLSELNRARRSQKMLNKLQRNNMIRFLYAQFMELQTNHDFIEHPILGRLTIRRDLRGRSERALWLVNQTMDKRLGYYPPTEGTIRNIISRKIKSTPFS